jgi:hypothetical protein
LFTKETTTACWEEIPELALHATCVDDIQVENTDFESPIASFTECPNNPIPFPTTLTTIAPVEAMPPGLEMTTVFASNDIKLLAEDVIISTEKVNCICIPTPIGHFNVK